MKTSSPILCLADIADRLDPARNFIRVYTDENRLAAVRLELFQFSGSVGFDSPLLSVDVRNEGVVLRVQPGGFFAMCQGWGMACLEERAPVAVELLERADLLTRNSVLRWLAERDGSSPIEAIQYHMLLLAIVKRWMTKYDGDQPPDHILSEQQMALPSL